MEWETIQIQKPKTTSIKKLRQSVNMTQSQFAEWLSTSIENVENWERGKSKPSEMLLKLISYYVEEHKKGEYLYGIEHKTIYEHSTRIKIFRSEEEREKNIKLWYSNKYDIIVKKFKIKKIIE